MCRWTTCERKKKSILYQDLFQFAMIRVILLTPLLFAVVIGMCTKWSIT